MATEKKMTYAECVDRLLAGDFSEEVVSRAKALSASLRGHKGESETQKKKRADNEAKVQKLLDALASFPDGATPAELVAALPDVFPTYTSPQTIGVLLTPARERGEIEREERKGKVYYKLA